MADDNVVRLRTNIVTFSNADGFPVLIILPDGSKLRGVDRQSVKQLNSAQLLELIDDLVDLIARR